MTPGRRSQNDCKLLRWRSIGVRYWGERLGSFLDQVGLLEAHGFRIYANTAACDSSPWNMQASTHSSSGLKSDIMNSIWDMAL